MKMYSLLKVGSFQPAMLVYWSVYDMINDIDPKNLMAGTLEKMKVLEDEFPFQKGWLSGSMLVFEGE